MQADQLQDLRPLGVSNPLVVRIEMTLNCNHRCGYCYNPNARTSKMPLSQKIHQIRELVKIIRDWGTFDVTFTGGEPFTEPDVLYAGIEAVVECGMDFGINTNAALITPEDAKRLREYGVASIFASFPSYDLATFEAMTQVSGSYDRVMQGYENMANAGLKMAANMVVIKDPVNNVNHVYETGSMLASRFGISRFCTAPMSPSNKDQERFIITLDEIVSVLEQMVLVHQEFGTDLRNSRPIPICFLQSLDPDQAKRLSQFDFFRGCTIGVVNGMTVQLDGSLKPCPVMPFSIANVFNDDLGAVTDKMSQYDGKSTKHLKENAPRACRGCVLLSICKGGCKTEALALTGSIDAPSRFMQQPLSDMDALLRIMPDVDLIGYETLLVRRSLKYRQDSSDSFVVRAESFAVLNDKEFQLLQYLQSLGEFSPSEFVDRHQMNRGMFNLFLNKLYKAKALLTTRKEVNVHG